MKSIVLESVRIFLIIGSVVSLIIGSILFFRADIIQRINGFLNTWYSGRKKMKPLEIMRDTDTYFYRNNKLWGWVMLIASVFCLYALIANFPLEAVLTVFPSSSALGFLADIGLRTIRWLFIIFVAAGIPVWVLLIFNPERLKKISRYFNQWISTRLMLLPLEKMYFGVDSAVLKHHKVFGILITIGSAIILISLFRFSF